MKLENKTFYPELIGRIESIENNKFKILLDNGQIAKVDFVDNEGNNLDENIIKDFFKTKAEKNTKEQSINKIKKVLMEDKELQKQISEEIINENPDIVNNPMEMLQKVNDKIESIAKEKAFNKFLIKEGSVIRFAGITLYEDKEQLVITSKSINPKIPESGIYMFAVGNNKVPLYIIQNKNGKFLIKLSPLANEEQINSLIEQFMRTYKAATEELINNLPKIYISVSKEIYGRLSDKTKNIINDINNIAKEDNFDLKNIDNVREYAKKVKSIINWFKQVPFDVNIYLPLGISTEEYNEIIEENLKEKNGIIDKLIRTTFAKYKEHEIKLREEIEKEFKNLYNEKKLIFNSTMFSHDKYGFFDESVSRDFSLSSDNYTEIINKINELTKTFK